MARYTGPKFRLDRREGANLFLKGKRSSGGKHPIDKKGAVPPGQHGGKKTRRKVSEFGLQLREKQKVKRIYGILERQFRRYWREASKKKGATGEILLRSLETRLDNVIYRLGLASSRSQSRQLVSHGHVLVNGKKVDIPSFNLRVEDIVSLSPKAQDFALVKEALEAKKTEEIVSWLERKALIGKIKTLPAREEIGADINEQLIVEFYSR